MVKYKDLKKSIIEPSRVSWSDLTKILHKCDRQHRPTSVLTISPFQLGSLLYDVITFKLQNLLRHNKVIVNVES